MIKANKKTGAIISILASSVSSKRMVDTNILKAYMKGLPDDISTYISERVIPAVSLRPFSKLNRKAHRLLAKIGQRTLTFGYLVSFDSDLIQVERYLAAIKAEYEQEADNFIANYGMDCETVIAELKRRFHDFDEIDQLVHAVKLSQPTKQYLRRQIGFDYSILELGQSSATGELNTVMEQSKAKLEEGVFNNILEDLAKMAENFQEGLKKTGTIRRCLINGLVTHSTKIQKLAFVNHQIAPLFHQIDKVVAGIPEKGTLTIENLNAFKILLTTLSDPFEVKYRLDNELPLVIEAVEVEDEEESVAHEGSDDSSPDETIITNQPAFNVAQFLNGGADYSL